VIIFPSTIDLGEREQGQVVVTRFTISNDGVGDLQIQDVSTNCSCSGLERYIDGKFWRVESLRLGTGEKAELATRISVRGEIGSKVSNAIRFQTNDPAHPTGSIVSTLVVTGGVEAIPHSVVLGKVLVGAEARQILEIRDRARQLRAVRRVESSDAARISVRLLPVDDASVPGPESGSQLLARVEVSVKTDLAGLVEGYLFIHLDDQGRQPDSVPVSARVVPPVEAMPAHLVLPRSSNTGKLFFARSRCWSNNGKPLSLIPIACPLGLEVRSVSDEDDPSLVSIRVEWRSEEHPELAGKDSHVIRLQAKSGDQESTVEITVACRAKEGV
jgi:hypothetical protein